MTPFIAEFIGTGILVLLGNGVVANVVLTDTKGQNGGWIVITTGWALGGLCRCCDCNTIQWSTSESCCHDCHGGCR